jgi:hypothetical protein
MLPQTQSDVSELHRHNFPANGIQNGERQIMGPPPMQ